jgi:hypothetical protein
MKCYRARAKWLKNLQVTALFTSHSHQPPGTLFPEHHHPPCTLFPEHHHPPRTLFPERHLRVSVRTSLLATVVASQWTKVDLYNMFIYILDSEEEDMVRNRNERL